MEKIDIFLDQKGSSWYEFAWINQFMIMNLTKDRRPKGGDHGNRNQRPVDGRKPAQEADLWQV